MHFFKKSILTYSLSLCSLSFPENPLETLGHAQFPVLLLPIVLRPSPLKLSTVTAPLKLLLSRTSAASGYKIQRPIFIFTQPHSSIFSQFTLFITNSFLVLACQITYEVRWLNLWTLHHELIWWKVRKLNCLTFVLFSLLLPPWHLPFQSPLLLPSVFYSIVLQWSMLILHSFPTLTSLVISFNRMAFKYNSRYIGSCLGFNSLKCLY